MNRDRVDPPMHFVPLIDPPEAGWSPPTGERTTDQTNARPWDELSASGLLWLINASVFHPRGYALALHRNTMTNEIEGWSLVGDGSEPWSFSDEGLPAGYPTIDELFRLAKGTLR
jgi:hypothetical protein